MNKKIILTIFLLILIVLVIFLYKLDKTTNKNCESLEENEKDDCFHSLAHELNDKNICYSIVEIEAKENCILHVAG